MKVQALILLCAILISLFIYFIIWHKRRKQNSSSLPDQKFPEENCYPILRVAQDGKLLYANRASKPLLDTWNVHVESYLPKAWISLIQDTLHLGDVKEVDVKTDQAIFSVAITPIKNENYVNLYCIDITTRKAYEEQLKYLTSHDPLTDLPSRHYYENLLEQNIISASYTKQYVALLFIGIDGFKTIDAIYGHALGEQLVKNAAQRLKDNVAANSLAVNTILARVGGSEFAIIQAEIAGPTVAERLCRKIIGAFRRPFKLDGKTIRLTVSLGIALYPYDGKTSVKLLQNADLAMYHARAQGKNQYQFFTESINKKMAQRQKLFDDLHTALTQNQLVLYYQPQHQLKTGKLVGAEALVRWQHPELGLLMPDQFISLLEESDLIAAFTKWLLKQGCQQLIAWEALGVAPLRLALNLSAAAFQHKKLVTWVATCLKKLNIDANQLELEITERIAIRDAEFAIKEMHALRELGVQLAIDDFGVEYSSMRYLQRFPVWRIKLDKSFVAGIGSKPEDEAIVKAIINLSHSLGKEITAEGVETQAQLAFLKAQDCNEAQGYYFSRPLDAEMFVEYIVSALEN